MSIIEEEEDFTDGMFVNEGNAIFIAEIDLAPLEREVFKEEVKQDENKTKL